MKTKFFFFWILVLLAAPGNGMAEEAPCTDQTRLTRTARTALAAAQKLAADKDAAGARTGLETFVRDYPDQNHVYVAFTLAGLCLEAGDLKTAKGHYETSVDLCPAYAPAWQNLAKVSYDLGRFARAALAFERAWELGGKKDPLILFHGAVAHVSAKSPDKALSHLVFLCSGEAGEPKPEWVRLLARLALELKQHSKALAVVEGLLAGPEPPSYLFRLAATLYLDLNQYGKAARALEAYALLEPLKRSERTLLGDLNNVLGIFARAAGHYEDALAMEPSQVIHERMAAAWFEACEREKSLAAVQHGIERYPASHALWKLAGWLYYETKSFQEASQAFARAFSLDSKDTRSLFMHGLCAHRSGAYDTARTVLKKAAADKNYTARALGLIRQMETAGDRT